MHAMSENEKNGESPDEASSEISEATEQVETEVKEPPKRLRDPLDIYRIKELETKVAEFESKYADVREYVKKMESEMEQIRIRTQRDLQKNTDAKIVNFFQEILPVLDNFERSLKAGESEAGAFVQGVRLVTQQFEETLKRAGLVRMKTKGEVFNPSFHEALTTMPVQAEDQDGLVMEEVVAGYLYKELVVRPAQVVVGSKISG